MRRRRYVGRHRKQGDDGAWAVEQSDFFAQFMPPQDSIPHMHALDPGPETAAAVRQFLDPMQGRQITQGTYSPHVPASMGTHCWSHHWEILLDGVSKVPVQRVCTTCGTRENIG